MCVYLTIHPFTLSSFVWRNGIGLLGSGESPQFGVSPLMSCSPTMCQWLKGVSDPETTCSPTPKPPLQVPHKLLRSQNGVNIFELFPTRFLHDQMDMCQNNQKPHASSSLRRRPEDHGRSGGVKPFKPKDV